MSHFDYLEVKLLVETSEGNDNLKEKKIIHSFVYSFIHFSSTSQVSLPPGSALSTFGSSPLTSVGIDRSLVNSVQDHGVIDRR